MQSRRLTPGARHVHRRHAIVGALECRNDFACRDGARVRRTARSALGAQQAMTRHPVARKFGYFVSSPRNTRAHRIEPFRSPARLSRRWSEVQWRGISILVVFSTVNQARELSREPCQTGKPGNFLGSTCDGKPAIYKAPVGGCPMAHRLL